MNLSAETLADAAAHVLSEAAFIVAETQTGQEAPPAEVVAQLSFGAPLAGWIRLEATRAGAAVVAANMLGCDPNGGDVDTKAQDALGELLNMIAGVVARSLLDAGRSCRIGVPEVNATLAPLPAPAPEHRVVLLLDDEHFMSLRACASGVSAS